MTTNEPPRRTVPAKTAAGLAAIASAILLVAPFTTQKEGVVTHPYADPVGIKTVCVGETQGIQDRTYTRAECAAMLQKRMAEDYATPLVNAIPTLAENVPALGALSDFAYNAGVARAINSPMATHFRKREWRAGCDAFSGYIVTARGRKLPGLVKRREDERRLCLNGVG